MPCGENSFWSPENVRKLRASYNMTREEFCRFIDCSYSALAHWETGTSEPPGKARARLLDLLALASPGAPKPQLRD